MKAVLVLLLVASSGYGIQDSRSQIRDSTSDVVVIDRMMAVVGGQPILLSDVDAAIAFHLTDAPPGPNQLAATLDLLIQRRLMLAEVERFQPPEPEPVEITIRIDAMERGAGSRSAFDRTLAVTGISRAQLRHYVRDDLRIATYLNQRFVAVADPAERKAAIQSWVAELRRRADVSILYSAR
jgi:hypothetical protein